MAFSLAEQEPTALNENRLLPGFTRGGSIGAKIGVSVAGNIDFDILQIGQHRIGTIGAGVNVGAEGGVGDVWISGMGRAGQLSGIGGMSAAMESADGIVPMEAAAFGAGLSLGVNARLHAAVVEGPTVRVLSFRAVFQANASAVLGGVTASMRGPGTLQVSGPGGSAVISV